ncbi:MAG: hypothetical protein MUF21_11890 [Gemmatimonadaceae bacterium]|jgi:hypothetical protein|nr:hypothetical protein [Gemmatimonadaceae bacterium]
MAYPKLFSRDELEAALQFVFDPATARRHAEALDAMPDARDHLAGRVSPDELARITPESVANYTPDTLDLLTLVSDSCAERAWRQLGISPEEGERRRAALRARIDETERPLP